VAPAHHPALRGQSRPRDRQARAVVRLKSVHTIAHITCRCSECPACRR
jgi:hypothetical protein